MTFKNLLILILIGLSLVLFSSPEKEHSYKIGAEDLIEISVFNVPELNKVIRVAQDGTINLALIGKIQVADLTRFELEKKLASLLAEKYLKNPQVTVFIKEYKSQSISIIGAVRNPGIYKLFGNKTLLDGITMAGGLSVNETGIAVIIRKYQDGSSNSLKIDLNKLMMGQNPELNIPLKAGDIINIPQKKQMSVYIFGQVERPGEVKLEDKSSPTLLQAIAAAGGFTSRARKRAILVKRVVEGKEKKYTVNVIKILHGRQKGFPLRDKDIIHVPESIL